MNDALTPKAVVAALDAHIIGQQDAKRAVAVALRNRWRPAAAAADASRRGDAQEHHDDRAPRLRQDRRSAGASAKLADCAVREGRSDQVHEVGYVGRDVEQIARDLVEEAVRLEKERRRIAVKDAAEEAGDGAAARRADRQGRERATRESFRRPFPRRHLAYERDRDRRIDAPTRRSRYRNGRPGRHDQPREIMGKALGSGPRSAAG
jgi:ATP-dependent HslUV protease ATP-binding subunit HslU